LGEYRVVDDTVVAVCILALFLILVWFVHIFSSRRRMVKLQKYLRTLPYGDVLASFVGVLKNSRNIISGGSGYKLENMKASELHEKRKNLAGFRHNYIDDEKALPDIATGERARRYSKTRGDREPGVIPEPSDSAMGIVATGAGRVWTHNLPVGRFAGENETSHLRNITSLTLNATPRSTSTETKRSPKSTTGPVRGGRTGGR
jgi:hypothetical protein